MFHQKIGVFEDSFDNVVAFTGSNNESVSGWMEMGNSETFSVFSSWRDSNDSGRVEELQLKLSKLWNNQYPGYEIFDYNDGLEFIQRRAADPIDLPSLKQLVRTWYERRAETPHAIAETPLRPYQSEVLENWAAENYKGIVCFATGAGKTITALAAIADWHKVKPSGATLVIVPTVRLQTQWVSEIRKHYLLSDAQILKVGGDGGAAWRPGLSGFMAEKENSKARIAVAVIDSAVSAAFLERAVWGAHILLIADEVHNMGAEAALAFLKEAHAGRVLGLSATPKRYNDDENIAIREFFGNDLKPIVDIPYAQDLGVLVRYQYHYETVELTPDEQEKHRKLTRAVGVAMGRSDSGASPKQSLQILLAQRANILKSASNKVAKAAQVLRSRYKPGTSWLVFCNDQAQLNALKILIADLSPLDYHGASEGGSNETLELFASSGGILLSIHMLDEGIDIPSIDSALIIASSKNERQFIQRRGRVLRVNRDKAKVADIWDILVTDETGRAYTDSEVDRAIEFAKMAINKALVYDLMKLRQEPRHQIDGSEGAND
jgi:superfamily II DNA or RNA helicase